MKTVEYDEYTNMMVVCPICKKVVYDGSKDEGIKHCQHLQGWYTNVDNSMLFVSSNFEADMNAYLTLNEDADESDYIATTLNKKGTRVGLYRGGYIGGCVDAHDTVIFSAVTKKTASVKAKKDIRKSFYKNCIKHGMTQNEVEAMLKDMVANSTKDIMAGIKAGKQRKLNARAKKAWATRKAKAKA